MTRHQSLREREINIKNIFVQIERPNGFIGCSSRVLTKGETFKLEI